MSFYDHCKTTIVGRISRDPDLTYTSSGFPILKLGLAYSRSQKDRDGNYSDKSCFLDAIVLGKRAESLSQFLAKGTKVFASGQLDHQTWESREGDRRSKHELVVDELIAFDKQGGGQ